MHAAKSGAKFTDRCLSNLDSFHLWHHFIHNIHTGTCYTLFICMHKSVAHDGVFCQRHTKVLHTWSYFH